MTLDGRRAVNYTGMPSGGGTSDPTAQIAMRRLCLQKKIRHIQKIVYDTNPDIYPYLLAAVTTGETYESLRSRGLHIGKNTLTKYKYEIYKTILNQI